MKKTRIIILISTYLSLAIVLDFIKKFIPFLNMPSGGSINIALIPVVLCSFHMDVKFGVLTGFLWFILSSIIGLNSYFISFAQIIFDYIIPSCIIGFASFFYVKKNFFEIELGIFITMLIRTLSICFAGAYFWYGDSSVALSKNAWLFSFAYNLPYSIASTIMLLIIIPIALKNLNKYLYNK